MTMELLAPEKTTPEKTAPHGPDRLAPAGGTDAVPGTARRPTRDVGRADEPAVASFVLGLIGLLVMNVVLGPLAIALATLAFVRGTTRRGRAALGLTLGVTDLIVLGVLLAHNDTVSFSF